MLYIDRDGQAPAHSKIHLRPSLIVMKALWLLIMPCALCSMSCSTEDTSPQPPHRDVRPAPPKVITHPAYAPSTTDPLAALYGGRDPKSGSRKVSAADLKRRFDRVRAIPLSTPLSAKWRKPLDALTRAPHIKVSSWSYQEQTRMDRAPRNLSFKITIKAWGERAQVNREVLSALKQIRDLRGKLPRRWGDGHEHLATSRNITFKLKRSASRALDSADPTRPVVLATFELSWERQTPTQEATRSCRYLPGLKPELSESFPAWAKRQFTSISTRRFIEWSLERGQREEVSRAMWIYRNGEQHDLAIRWWVQRLEQRGATRTALESLEQTWRLKRGGELSWWPETNPDPMGCQVAGSLLVFEYRRPHQR